MKEYFDKEQTGYLVQSILAAIRWNSLCENSRKYDIDGENVYTLVCLLENILTSSIYVNGSLVLNIPTTAPIEEKNRILLALLAAFRWNAICDDGSQKTEEDINDVEFLAAFMEQLIESKEVLLK